MSESPIRLRHLEGASTLDSTVQQLRAAGADRAARRLKVVDELTGELDYPALERLADPKLADDELTVHRRRRVRILHAVRNIFALLPLIWTWATVGIAAVQYQHELAMNPSSASKPFLYLWQEGFGGRSISFSWVAAIDVIMLIILVFVVFASRWIESRESRNQVELVDKLYLAIEKVAVAGSHRVPTIEASGDDDLRAATAALLGNANDFERSARIQAQLLAELRDAVIGFQETQLESSAKFTSLLSQSEANSYSIAASLKRLAGTQAELAQSATVVTPSVEALQTGGSTSAGVESSVQQLTDPKLAELIDSVHALLRNQQDFNRELLRSLRRQDEVADATSGLDQPVARQDPVVGVSSVPDAPRRGRSLARAFTDGLGGVFDLFGGIGWERKARPSFEDGLVDDARSLCAALGLMPQGGDGHKNGSRS
jgi:hypothetical protein